MILTATLIPVRSCLASLYVTKRSTFDLGKTSRADGLTEDVVADVHLLHFVVCIEAL